MEPILELLDQLAPAMPETMDVLVMADRGLWSRRLWGAIRGHGWHPVMRVQNDIHFRPAGQKYLRAASLVSKPGEAWVGTGQAFNESHRSHRGLKATLSVWWGEGHKEPWLVLSDIEPEKMGVSWYRLRMWIELGFRALKGFGWRWDHTRRTDPERVARHWLVMAVATLWVLPCGTRIDEAMRLKKPAHRHHHPDQPEMFETLNRVTVGKRTLSLFSLGLHELCKQFIRGRLWTVLWLRPDPRPEPPPGILIVHASSP